ncbi:MAG: hypothetical protein LC798_07215 [Chloroflexi bacterium]|nr:hypothetical protein [Chloroflexota bacterium]
MQNVDLQTVDDEEWDYEKVRRIAKILTVDADGNDATSPDFDPNNVVQYGFQPVCNITGFNVYALAGSEADADCGQVESSLRNMLGTGVFQGLINDPRAGIRRGPDPAAELEDTHIFSSNFYLTGLYSLVDGGFQLVPQGGTSAGIKLDQELEDVNFFAGWVPTSSSATGGPGQSPTIGPNGTHSFFVLQRSDFISCPGGAYLIKGNLGDPIDLGNGSSFQPFHNSFQLYQTERPQEQYKLDCSNFFNTGNLSHELKFGAGYRGGRGGRTRSRLRSGATSPSGGGTSSRCWRRRARKGTQRVKVPSAARAGSDRKVGASGRSAGILRVVVSSVTGFLVA